MDFQLHHGFVLLLMILILTHVLPLSADNKKYTCGQSFQCGNIPNINYPFWDENRPKYCGHPSFQLTNCKTNDYPTITINSTQYRVLDIHSQTQTLKVVRDDYRSDLCPPSLRNATLDGTHFSYATDTDDLMLYYNCQINSTTAQPNQFFCLPYKFGFYASKGVPLNDGVVCDTVVSVRVQVSLTNTGSFNGTKVVWDGFGLQWNANNDDCKKCVDSGGRCGSDPDSGSFDCYPNPNPGRDGGALSPGEIAILASGSAAISIIIITCCCLRRYRTLAFCKERAESENCKKRAAYENIEALIRNHVSNAPKRYKFSDVNKITNSFKDKLGQGGYGTVYKGKLSDGRLVAVKVLSETETNREDFVNEVISISRTSHINVVTLLGFCLEKKKRALIYEFMARGSLDKPIGNDESTIERLDCRTLYQIAVGVARGLEYLHRGCNARIVHFDIKPHNILLDENFCPKISDFGLAKLCQSKQSIISMLGARGTVGYIAPEVFSRTFGAVSHKSDVYSYGMLVLEIIGAGKKGQVIQNSEVFFPDWIYEHLEHGKELPICAVSTGEEEEIVKKMILVGLWCIQTKPSDRPPISKVVEMLEGNIESLQIPPKPCLFSTTIPDLSLQNSSEALSLVNIVGEVLEGSLQSSEI